MAPTIRLKLAYLKPLTAQFGALAIIAAGLLSLAANANASTTATAASPAVTVAQPADEAPPCVTVDQKWRPYGKVFIITNRCGAAFRVKLIHDFASDSRCYSLRDGQEARDRTGPQARLNRVVTC